MAKIEIINQFGKMVGWSKVELRLLGRDVVGVRKVQYNDEIDKDLEYGSGRMPIGTGEGNYKAEASIELTFEEVRALLAVLPVGSFLQDIPQFPIIVAFDHNGTIYTDILHNCQFTNNGIDVKQGDKTIATDFKLLITHITRN